jgi:predicted site-specific integrase-resolvase
MTPKQAIAHWTNQATLAKVLGVSRQVVNNWKKRGHIPLDWQMQIAEVSFGYLKISTRKRKLQT